MILLIAVAYWSPLAAFFIGVGMIWELAKKGML